MLCKPAYPVNTSGSSKACVRCSSAVIRSRRSSQLCTGLLGCRIFLGDCFNPGFGTMVKEERQAQTAPAAAHDRSASHWRGALWAFYLFCKKRFSLGGNSLRRQAVMAEDIRAFTGIGMRIGKPHNLHGNRTVLGCEFCDHATHAAVNTVLFHGEQAAGLTGCPEDSLRIQRLDAE